MGNKKSGCSGCLIPCLIVFVIFGIIGSCGKSDDSVETVAITTKSAEERSLDESKKQKEESEALIESSIAESESIAESLADITNRQIMTIAKKISVNKFIDIRDEIDNVIGTCDSYLKSDASEYNAEIEEIKTIVAGLKDKDDSMYAIKRQYSDIDSEYAKINSNWVQDFYVVKQIPHSFNSVINGLLSMNDDYNTYYANDVRYNEWGASSGEQEYALKKEGTFPKSGVYTLLVIDDGRMTIEESGGFTRSIPLYRVISDNYIETVTNDYNNYFNYVKNLNGDFSRLNQLAEIISVGQVTNQNTNIAAVNESEDYVLPDSSSRIIKQSEIEKVSKAEIRIAINEIYARHGRIYESEDLNQYFNSKAWYKGSVKSDQFSDNMLSQIEKDNIIMLAEYRDALNGSAKADEYSEFEPEWIYGTYECRDGMDATLEVGVYSGSGNTYFTIYGQASNISGEYTGELISENEKEYQTMDQEGNLVTFLYDGLGTIEVKNSSVTGLDFDGIFIKVMDMSRDVS